MNFMIVDDEVLIRQWFRFCLEANSFPYHRIDEASNGREALDKLVECRPDIIIADIQMPVLDGLQLLKEVNSRYPDIDVILLTSHAEFQYARQAVKLGAADYLLKAEIKQNDVIDTLERVIANRKKTSQSPLSTKNKLNSQYGHVVAEAITFMEQHYTEALSLKDVAGIVHLHANYFSQVFKERVGINFNEYLTNIRIEKSKDYLLHTDLRAYEVAEKVGYPNFSYFSKVFRKVVGKSPMEFRMNSEES